MCLYFERYDDTKVSFFRFPDLLRMLNMPFASLKSISVSQLKNLLEAELIEAGSTLTNNPNVELAPKIVMRTFQLDVFFAITHFTIVVKRTRQGCQMVLGYAQYATKLKQPGPQKIQSLEKMILMEKKKLLPP